MLLQTLRVLNSQGQTLLDISDIGVRDGSNRILQASEFIFDRLFATPLAAYMWTCLEGVWQVSAVNAKCSVTGGAAATCDVLVCSGVVAPGSGVTQLTTVLDVEATAPFSVNGVLITTPTNVFPGDSIARVLACTVGAIEGLLTVQIKRVQ